MGTNAGAIDVLYLPIKLVGGICLLLHGMKDAVPDACSTPAIKAISDRLPGAVPIRHVTPGSTRPVNPQDAIDNTAMVHRRTARMWLLRWQQGVQSRPLCVRQISSAHALYY